LLEDLADATNFCCYLDFLLASRYQLLFAEAWTYYSNRLTLISPGELLKLTGNGSGSQTGIG
jgi:hypothetical protein